MKRVIWIVLDSVGIGALPDAHLFADEGCDTIGGIINASGLICPNLKALGLYNIQGTTFHSPIDAIGCYGKCSEKTLAKDTTSGHWEMAGYIMDKPFKTFPNGFDKEIIEQFEAKIGCKVLGNCVASGTEIIQRLGDEHVKSAEPIIYTSADSVFQIACHEEIIPIDELYKMCKIARAMLMGDNAVGRVIARPFEGKSGEFKRTKRRKDFALEPDGETILDYLDKNGIEVYAIGKIEDIFCNRGITKSDHTTSNKAGIESTIKQIKSQNSGLIFTNLVDFDMLYGHRNDIEGYRQSLEEFDSYLPEILNSLNKEDLLIITADHGCDPSFKGTDHTREYVPTLAYGKSIKKGVDLGIMDSFADMGATIIEYLADKKWNTGKSFLNKII